LLLVLLLAALAGCTETVEVTVNAPSSDWQVYGVDTITVTCHPTRYVDYVELLIDSAVVGRDTYPDPTYSFAWDVTRLREGSAHRVQARAISGSREYLSPELLAAVGFRSRLLLDGGDSLWVYRPDGVREAGIVPLEGADPASPRFRPGCGSVVFLWNRKLYEATVLNGQAQLLDSVENGIYDCDASPISNLVAFDGLPAATAHLFIKDGTNPKVQLTHDSDFVIIDSSRFTCTANLDPVFSPDGAKLAYRRESKCLVPGDPHEGETRQDAFVMNRDGSNLVNMTPDMDNGYFSGFTWTFDGRWVLFQGSSKTFAANLGGRVFAIQVSQSAPVAMTCSPGDSVLAYIDPEYHKLCSVRLAWTADTLYVSGEVFLLSGESFGGCVDWVGYSEQ